MSLNHKNLSVNDFVYVVRNNQHAKIISKHTDGIVVRYDGQEHLEFLQHVNGSYFTLENGNYISECNQLALKISGIIRR